MRVALALVALTGCSQIFGLSEPVHAAQTDAALVDALVDDVIEDVVVADAAVRLCDPTQADLVACFDFEGSVESDTSAAIVVSASNYTFVSGRVGSAVHVDATTTYTIGETTALDVAAVTTEAWIYVDALPAAGLRMGVWDTNGQYGMFIRDTGVIACTNGGLGVTSLTAVAANEWTHVACTTSTAGVNVYKNGLVSASGPGTTIPTVATDGSVVGGNSPTGERFTGTIDSLRVYNSARSDQQICKAAGC